MTDRCYICGKNNKNPFEYYHAKCLKKLLNSTKIPAFNYSQEDLNNLAKNIILNRISVPGVQPKLSLHLEKWNNANSRLTLVGLEGNYILKPQTPDWPFMPESEHFAMLFANLCNIETAEFGLIPLKDKKLAYITKRMDRTANGLVHMEDFCQLTNKQTSQKYNGSMEQIAKAIVRFSDNIGLDLIKFFQITVFCFLIGNSDMHLKNFSLIHRNKSFWELAPAYDLVPVKLIMPADKEELALMLCGKKTNFNYNNFKKFAANIGLSEIQFKKNYSYILNITVKKLDEALLRSFLPNKMQILFKKEFLERYNRIIPPN